jgi:hypothetical protein
VLRHLPHLGGEVCSVLVSELLRFTSPYGSLAERYTEEQFFPEMLGANAAKYDFGITP